MRNLYLFALAFFFFLQPSLAANNAVLRFNPLIYYSFDACVARNEAGGNLNGMVVGSPECIDGVKGKALYFNRFDRNNGCGRPGGDYVQLPKLKALWDKGITLCAWVKFSNQPRFFERIADLGNAPGEDCGYNFIFGRLDRQNSIVLESWVNCDGGENRGVGRLVYSVPQMNRWHFYCAVIDNPKAEMSIYVDGRKVASKRGNPIMNITRVKNFIGHSNWCFNDPDLKGALDEFMIFNRPLTPSQIAQIYSSYRGGATDFGSTEYTKNAFVGEVFFIPPGTLKMPNFNLLKPVGKIYTKVLNVTPRRFDSGFPGISNRLEWFAIRYRGRFYTKRPGAYKFALLSDDGAKLFIDGRLVIDNDGIHPAREKTGSVWLSRGWHSIEVQYFQGPRFQLALVLYIIRNGRKIPFSLDSF